MKENTKRAIIKFLEEAESDAFFGSVEFKFKEGKIYHIEKRQSLKLEDIEANS
jgi:hypothetical protein